jgi:hypothetical protein
MDRSGCITPRKVKKEYKENARGAKKAKSYDENVLSRN